jgi:hypothetical protein
MLRFPGSLDSTNNSRTHTEREAREETTDVQQTSETPRAPLAGVTKCPACHGAGYIRVDLYTADECVFCQ